MSRWDANIFLNHQQQWDVFSMEWFVLLNLLNDFREVPLFSFKAVATLDWTARLNVCSRWHRISPLVLAVQHMERLMRQIIVIEKQCVSYEIAFSTFVCFCVFSNFGSIKYRYTVYFHLGKSRLVRVSGWLQCKKKALQRRSHETTKIIYRTPSKVVFWSHVESSFVVVQLQNNKLFPQKQNNISV